ncbi:enoyl-CoA hydratase/isomerase family protein [Bradyrhizobium tropiciagri]|uniref:enoyl-CoA hydratase/isomerase family protein n=1 Tax=Bradyrhizobium tropiciagri TaxID=312253 RepID=UPI001BAC241D|nr:enoyl-CoA hydratase-related protein [Bradyrhizobium tropiciagri]MBR0899121.1 enoyl-CoA hydratase/isomerase family protein [Bradyrhizobium tropiciagri]
MNSTSSSLPSALGIKTTWDRGVARIEFDLAQPKNSFRVSDVERLDAALDEAKAGGARCIVLRGARGTFSAGWDVTSINPASDDPMAMITDVVAPFCRKLRALPVPTISAVAGVALGFGLGLALCCDICVVDGDARVGSPFRGIGMVPDTATHYFFLTRLGQAKAAELIYTGRLITGAEAAQIGLVNRATEVGSVNAAVDELALSIAEGPTAAFRLSKEILLAGGDFGGILAHEGRQLERVFETADLKEGIRAFQQRRAPRFEGC